jgi:hypothetical protein
VEEEYCVTTRIVDFRVNSIITHNVSLPPPSLPPVSFLFSLMLVDDRLPTSLLPSTVSTPPRRRQVPPSPPKERDEEVEGETTTELSVCDKENPTSSIAVESDDEDSQTIEVSAVPLSEHTMTLKELKELCQARGIATHGKKGDLVKRLQVE